MFINFLRDANRILTVANRLTPKKTYNLSRTPALLSQRVINTQNNASKKDFIRPTPPVMTGSGQWKFVAEIIAYTK